MVAHDWYTGAFSTPEHRIRYQARVRIEIKNESRGNAMKRIQAGLCRAALAAALVIAQSDTRADPLPVYLTFPPPDANAVDTYIPVITMEQIGESRSNLQGYRIQIFKDGRAIYHGLLDVKRLGEVRFRIKPDQVQKIQAEFAKYNFWQVPSDQFGRGEEGPGWRFALREGNRTKYLIGNGNGYQLLLLRIIEDEVQSVQWRCHYVDLILEKNCAVREKSRRDSIDFFSKHYLAQFLDTYK